MYKGQITRFFVIPMVIEVIPQSIMQTGRYTDGLPNLSRNKLLGPYQCERRKSFKSMHLSLTRGPKIAKYRSNSGSNNEQCSIPA